MSDLYGLVFCIWLRSGVWSCKCLFGSDKICRDRLVSKGCPDVRVHTEGDSFKLSFPFQEAWAGDRSFSVYKD